MSPEDMFWASVTESLTDVKFIMNSSFFGTIIYFSVTTEKKKISIIISSSSQKVKPDS